MTPRKKKSRESGSPGVERVPVPRAVWKGAVSFGLVNIPVGLYSAVRSKDIRFHMLHEKDHSRIQQKIFCLTENREISRDDTVKGFEVAPGQHVVVRDEELDSVAPKAGRAIELLSFAKLSEIDSLYFAQPYYLIPEPAAVRAYGLFVEALRGSARIGLARLVMRKKEYMAALRPLENLLCLEIMHFPDEIVRAGELSRLIPPVEVSERERKTAEQLIDSLSEPFDAARYHDHYREAVMRLIQRKMEGKQVVMQPEEAPEATQVVDLMSALEASLEEAKRRRKKTAA